MVMDMNTRGFERLAGMWMVATRKSLNEWLTHAGRVLVSYLIAITPPFGKSPINTWRNGGTLDHKRIGENAVRRDILKIFPSIRSLLGIHQNTLGRAARYLQKYARANDLPKIYKILDDFGIRAEVDIRPTPEKHRARIKRRYDRFSTRVVGRPVYVTDEKALDAYIKTVQKDVGKAKAGWLPSAIRIGLQSRYMPAWVRRHIGQGTFVDQRHNPQAPSYTFVNGDGNADAAREMIPAAIRLFRITEQKSINIMLAKGYGRIRPRIMR